MRAAIAILGVGALAVLIAPIRRLRRPLPPQPARMDAATYAALLAEAERIASPFKQHVRVQLVDLGRPPEEELGGDFPEVDALLERAGILV
jgi:hypothetical protein